MSEIEAMSVSKEAIEAGLSALIPLAIHPDDMDRALTAALPFLTRPAPSQSDEERAREFALELHDEFIDNDIRNLAKQFATVRAEATLAGAAAEREAACIIVKHRWSEGSTAIISAIRARK